MKVLERWTQASQLVLNPMTIAHRNNRLSKLCVSLKEDYTKLVITIKYFGLVIYKRLNIFYKGAANTSIKALKTLYFKPSQRAILDIEHLSDVMNLVMMHKIPTAEESTEWRVTESSWAISCIVNGHHTQKDMP